MRVLVTGGSGLVGSHAIAELAASGHEVRALARSQERLTHALEPFGVSVEAVLGDMTDQAAVRSAVQGCDAVVHAAAAIGVHGGESIDMGANLAGTRLVIEEALAAGAQRLVYTSSMSAYLPSSDAVLNQESALAEPSSPYARSKRDVELLVRGWQSEGAPITTLVLGAVYGPPSPHPTQSFASILGALRSGFMVSPPSGLCVVDARDVAVLCARVVDRAPTGPHHLLAGGTFVTWEQWVDTLSETSGRVVTPIPMTADELIALGATQDELRAAGQPPTSNVSVEAATIMTSGRPSDDRATLDLLGATYRPVEQTFADTAAYLFGLGLVPGSS